MKRSYFLLYIEDLVTDFQEGSFLVASKSAIPFDSVDIHKVPIGIHTENGTVKFNANCCFSNVIM